MANSVDPGGGGGVLKYEIGIYVIYMRPTGFKNGGAGLREWPLTENGGLAESGLSRDKQGILELKITWKRIFFSIYLFDLPRSENRNKELCIF